MKISCIMPSMDSRCISEHVDTAIECFARQTWPDKELVIVAESPRFLDVYGGLLEAYGITAVKAVVAKGSTGAKRNIACQLATGDVIAHWDDDDYSAPSRLWLQAHLLHNCHKPVTGFHSMYYTDGRRWWKYSGHLQDTNGTGLMYGRDWWEAHHFADKVIGEDADFVVDAIRANALYSVDAATLMYATCHPGNTSPRVMPDKCPPGCSFQEVEKPEAFK